MIVPVMAISNLVLTQQIYSEETNGAHAHYREPVPLNIYSEGDFLKLSWRKRDSYIIWGLNLTNKDKLETNLFFKFTWMQYLVQFYPLLFHLAFRYSSFAFLHFQAVIHQYFLSQFFDRLVSTEIS